MSVRVRPCQSLSVCVSLCQSVSVHVSLCQSVSVCIILQQSVPVCGSPCQSVSVLVSPCYSVSVCVSLCQSESVHFSLCRSMLVRVFESTRLSKRRSCRFRLGKDYTAFHLIAFINQNLKVQYMLIYNAYSNLSKSSLKTFLCSSKNICNKILPVFNPLQCIV